MVIMTAEATKRILERCSFMIEIGECVEVPVSQCLRGPQSILGLCTYEKIYESMKIRMTENYKLVASYRSSKRLDRKNRDSHRDIMVMVSGCREVIDCRASHAG